MKISNFVLLAIISMAIVLGISAQQSGDRPPTTGGGTGGGTVGSVINTTAGNAGDLLQLTTGNRTNASPLGSSGSGLVAKTIGALMTNLTAVGPMTVSGSTAGQISMNDGTGKYFTFTTPTMASNANWTLPSVPATGLLFGLNTSPTNETVSHVNGVNGQVVLITNNVPTFVSGALFDNSTNNMTQKTFDASAAGNVLKLKSYLVFPTPHFGENTNAVPQTNDLRLATFGHYSFSGTAASNANYAVYLISVPTDIDTSVAMRALLKVRLSTTETSASTWHLGVQDVADSASGSISGAGNFVTVTIGADASGAANDIESSAWTTLTGWAAALTADHLMYIVLKRDGTDTANTAIYDAELKLEYGVTQ